MPCCPVQSRSGWVGFCKTPPRCSKSCVGPAPRILYGSASRLGVMPVQQSHHSSAEASIFRAALLSLCQIQDDWLLHRVSSAVHRSVSAGRAAACGHVLGLGAARSLLRRAVGGRFRSQPCVVDETGAREIAWPNVGRSADRRRILVSLDQYIVVVALPEIGRDLGYSAHTLQSVVSAYAVASSGFLLFGGRASDLLGRRRVLVTGLALYAFASLAGGLATRPEVLLTARSVQGLGGAL